MIVVMDITGFLSEQCGVIAILQTCVIGRSLFRISAGTLVILVEFLSVFPQYLQENTGIASLFGHHRFLPKPFKFIIDNSP
jgi:hypothetical protein